MAVNNAENNKRTLSTQKIYVLRLQITKVCEEEAGFTETKDKSQGMCLSVE